MKEIVYRLTISAVVYLFSANAAADIDCPAATVRHIQIEHSVIYVYLEGQQWHLLGPIDTVGTKERYSALLAAQMSGKKVTMRYPDGYDCQIYNLSIPAIMVRTHND